MMRIIFTNNVCNENEIKPLFFSAFSIRVKAGVTLAAAVSPYVMIVDCTDAVTAVSSTFTQPVLDKPPTFVSGIPGNSPDVSDDNVIATSLGKFTTTDPDTTCSVTLPVTTVYEIRKVASPTDPQKPAAGFHRTACDRN
ncbi:uncharacterized protein LOC127864860 isoform X2 [Dreissena polymorpha]|uniref:uncharacterized protein LOC127864860 isoform X2 n=1 Tax=Dreissena polymorpha TaxID=45954 RepID=UPI002264EACB|nr:uncharacterized protein LOC127864860 isoform X2 [Dreissena polymorpha]